ncbi:MAG: tyrosine--tRNA ligase [Pseudomonadota bacterium]
MVKSKFLHTLYDRGFVHDCTDLENLDQACHAGSITLYIGFDATAPSLHVGSLLPIMTMRWAQKSGHRVVVLMGGGTTRIGDPSGKDSQRKMMSPEDIQGNIDNIRTIFSNYLAFDDHAVPAIMANNLDWLQDLNYITFLRDYGRHFSVNRMLGFDSVKLRLDRDQPLSFLEFNYMILQAYDFLQLHRTYDCSLQLGGSDQWGNIVNGIELIRRVDGGRAYGLTTPLLTTASGAKMGKSAGGAVWLSADMLRDFDFWQYWRNVEDADVGKFLRLFTEIPMAEIYKLDALQGAELNEAKKILADAVTTLCRGEQAATVAHNTAQKTFESGQVAQDLPSLMVDASSLQNGIGLLDAITRIGFCTSNSEARRMVAQGGVRINNAVISDHAYHIKSSDLLENNDGNLKKFVKLSVGKKRHGLITLG